MENDLITIPEDDAEIRSRILTIRGVQVMLDRDIAQLYGVPTKVLNQTVKRNIRRFPNNFMFQLNKDELNNLKSQFATSKLSVDVISNTLRSQNVTSSWGGSRYRPFAFSEHGIIMLASLLKSETAIAMSIRIVNAFVAMRNALASIAPLLQRVEIVERRQITDQSHNEERFAQIFDAMNTNKFPPQKIFFKGMPEDAHSFVIKLIKKAKKTIILIDGYVDDVTLDILSKKRIGVSVTIATHPRTTVSIIDVEKFNKQYPLLTLKKTDAFHDRFLVIDDTLYHIGASLKDVGRLCFAIAELDAMFIPLIMQRI